MTQTSTLPTVASLWVGGALNWLHSLSLASFVHRGHPVVLFHHGPAPAVPDGVETRPVQEIWDPVAAGHGDAPASLLSDLFRVHLFHQTDMIWVDTDILCYRPLPDVDYLVGRELTGTVNGAVLRLPRDSEALNTLLDWYADPEWVPVWLNDKPKRDVAKAPPGQRLLTAFNLQRPSIGPRALGYTLRKTGEAKHILPADAFYPVRGVVTDILFSQYGNDGWLTDNTLAIHLYFSMVGRYHKAHRPEDNSFIARFADEIGFDLSALKHQKQGLH